VTRRISALAAALALLGYALPARAVEREHSLSLGVGAATLDIASKGSADWGAGAAISYTYGLSDAFNFMAEGSWSVVSLNESAPNAPNMVSTLNVGAGYVFDVVRWVPYAGLLAGTSLMNGGGIGGLKFVPEAVVALGFDYRIDRSFSLGVALRQAFFTDPSTYPSYSQAFARVGYVWGW
jgi:hypothetical protein